AAVDSAGNIRLAGRARDLIVLPSGLNVWPQDVEEALLTHPAVKDAVVMAVPQEGGGARLHAYLLPATPRDRGAEPGPIVARANSRLAPYQRVATASWWADPDFPRTPTLKVRRNLLPLPESDAVAVETTLAPALDGSEDPIAGAVAAVARLGAVHEDQTLA